MSLKSKMRTHFITGLVAILPLAITISIIWFLIQKIGGFLANFLTRIPTFASISKPLISVLGFITVIIVIYVIGLITSGFIGRWAIKRMDNIMAKVPFVKGFYNASRTLVNTIFIDRSAFSKVIIIKYPWEETYTLAFLTNEKKWKIGRKEYYNIFLPTSPNPTSGYYLLYPVSDVTETDIPVQDGLKIIASGGIMLPENIKY